MSAPADIVERAAPDPLTGRLSRALARPARLFALGAGLLLLAVTLVTTANAALFLADRVARLGGASVGALPGYEDFVRLAISAAAPMLFPWCQLARGHVAIDFVAQRLPAGLQRGLERAWLGLMAGAMLFLAGWMAVGLLEVRADRLATPILGWAQWPFYAPGTAALALAALIAAAQAVEHRPPPP